MGSSGNIGMEFSCQLGTTLESELGSWTGEAGAALQMLFTARGNLSSQSVSLR